MNEEKNYPVLTLCQFGKVKRSAYYNWLKHPQSDRERFNLALAKKIHEIHEKHPEKGYRGIRDELAVNHQIEVNDKRVLRICRFEHIQSTIKHSGNSITKPAISPYYLAENILNREFKAEKPNQKWLTDVTEFKYTVGNDVRKVYLSAILDLYGRRIVSYVIRDHNDLTIVLDTFQAAIEAEPEAQPLFHSDRGFQYTHKQFRTQLVEAGMTQSMSRVGKCIDNGPMEGFWGVLKREKYYTNKFSSREAIVQMITDFIEYYNSGRLQRSLKVQTPNGYQKTYYDAA